MPSASFTDVAELRSVTVSRDGNRHYIGGIPKEWRGRRLTLILHAEGDA